MNFLFGWSYLVIVFLRELALATWDTAKAVFSSTQHLRPAILAVPLDVRSDAGITMFANLVTLTPGTTSLEVSPDRRTLYVHCLDAPDPKATVQGMKDTLEQAVRKVLS